MFDYFDGYLPYFAIGFLAPFMFAGAIRMAHATVVLLYPRKK